jgi:signal transduction histidine kinase
VINLEELKRTASETTVDPLLIVDVNGEIRFATPGYHPWNRLDSKCLIDSLIEFERQTFQRWLQSIVQHIPVSHGEFQFVASDNVVRHYELFGLRYSRESKDREILLLGHEKSTGTNPRLCPSYASKETEGAIGALKSNLIGIISHELRTPLNGIIGATDVLVDSGLPLAQHEMLTCVREAAEALLGTVLELATYTSITSGIWPFNEQAFSLDDLIASIDSEFRQQANSKALFLEINRDKEIPLHLFGDGENISQIIQILLGNAIKFTKRGKVSLHFHNRGVDESSAAILLEVLDTGVGIEESALAWVCDPFRQVDTSCSREFSGLGLGLAICQILAFKLGTRVSFESSVGEGSRFWVPFRLGVSE